MQGQYQWVDVEIKGEISGEVKVQRVFRVTDLSLPAGKNTVDVPLDAGYARIRKGHHGAKSDRELLVGKVVCDKNDIRLIQKWLAGPAGDSERMDKMRAELIRLGVDPDKL